MTYIHEHILHRMQHNVKGFKASLMNNKTVVTKPRKSSVPDEMPLNMRDEMQGHLFKCVHRDTRKSVKLKSMGNSQRKGHSVLHKLIEYKG